MSSEPAAMDVEHLSRIRDSVQVLWDEAARQAPEGGVCLDVAPQKHGGIRSRLRGKRLAVHTIDIDPRSGADLIADICAATCLPKPMSYDLVVCTEVIEHVMDPFAAMRNLWSALKPGGALYLSTPFNFRIHGPLPDCWRFTEHGLRALLADFELLSIQAVETPGRPLMPIHYRVVARKPLLQAPHAPP